jgi:adenosylhomocysteine nucleosidase
MSRVAIIAALPAELRPLAEGWSREPRDGIHLWRRREAGDEWIAACAGMGRAAAARAWAEIEKDGKIDCALSVGWAGALREDLATGRAYRVDGVIDARTSEKFPAAQSSGGCWLVTVDAVAGPEEKRRLAEEHGAALVDMEAAAVAALARARGVPFFCVKAVSDSRDEDLPDLDRFIDPSGAFRPFRFAVYALGRPWMWPSLIRLGKNSNKAARGLKHSIASILDERRRLG